MYFQANKASLSRKSYGRLEVICERVWRGEHRLKKNNTNFTIDKNLVEKEI